MNDHTKCVASCSSDSSFKSSDFRNLVNWVNYVYAYTTSNMCKWFSTKFYSLSKIELSANFVEFDAKNLNVLRPNTKCTEAEYSGSVGRTTDIN